LTEAASISAPRGRVDGPPDLAPKDAAYRLKVHLKNTQVEVCINISDLVSSHKKIVENKDVYFQMIGLA
jgi:hypothetical protein